MSEAFKVLGQVNPASTTLTDLYDASTGLSGIVVSTITVCNRGSSADAFRVSVAPVGAADDVKHYLYYDVALPANDTFAATLGLTLEATDIVRVYAGSTGLSFNVFGSEIT